MARINPLVIHHRIRQSASIRIGPDSASISPDPTGIYMPQRASAGLRWVGDAARRISGGIEATVSRNPNPSSARNARSALPEALNPAMIPQSAVMTIPHSATSRCP